MMALALHVYCKNAVKQKGMNNKRKSKKKVMLE